MDDLIGKTCTHFKGGKYYIVGFAKHSEDHSELVVYRSAASGEMWARPRELFFDTIISDGKEVFRFAIDKGANLTG
ncbi:MAG: DUF1653 domain-containing protein [Roseinatronobacter sp.]